MTIMTIVDVVNILYLNQQELNNVFFGEDENNSIFITSWSVPNTPEPTVVYLQSQIPTLQKQFDLIYFVTNGMPQLEIYIDSVAQQKQYNNAVSCASYASSTIQTWKDQAICFIAWRDSVYNYTITQEALMKDGSRTVPTFEEFKAELPLINWPN